MDYERDGAHAGTPSEPMSVRCDCATARAPSLKQLEAQCVVVQGVQGVQGVADGQAADGIGKEVGRALR